jgi:hypothetical protein
MSKKNNWLHVRLTNKELVQLQSLCIFEKKSKSDMIRKLISNWFELTVHEEMEGDLWSKILLGKLIENLTIEKSY